MKNSALNLRTNDDLKKQFKIMCAVRGITMSEALEKLMKRELEEKEGN